ncbi:NB-ARC domain-containing protein [Streptomyces venezuelae]|uniref:NB-ARC domain-containing protein n=1 Tax=Streptomyces venezuelae TaxID=54571 RepID=UPI0034543F78
MTDPPPTVTYDFRGAQGVQLGHGNVQSNVHVPPPRRPPWMAPPFEEGAERHGLRRRLLGAVLDPPRGDAPVALVGPGGFGKTHLATWLCHRAEVREAFPGGLLWTTLSPHASPAELARALNELSYALSGHMPPLSDPYAAGAELGRLLTGGERVLLVVDDVWTAHQLGLFRHQGDGCVRLATTRVPAALPAASTLLHVGDLSAAETGGLLREAAAGITDAPLERLARRTGRWAVLVHTVARQLAARTSRGQDADDAAEAIARRLRDNGPAVLDPRDRDDRRRGVAATVEAGAELLAPGNRERLVDLALFPDAEPLPLSVLALLWGGDAEPVCEDLTDIGLLREYRLDDPPRIRVHDVIKEFLREQRPRTAWQELHRRLLNGCRTLLPDGPPTGPTPWWDLPGTEQYLWTHVPWHLTQSGSPDVGPLVRDVRWLARKIDRCGTALAERDLHLGGGEEAELLRRVLAQSAPLLESRAGDLAPTLVSRVQGIPGLADFTEHAHTLLPHPHLRPGLPLPDQPDPLLVRRLSGHRDSVASCEFSARGDLLATSGHDGLVCLWRVGTGGLLASLGGSADPVYDLSFSPNGHLLAGAARDVLLWDLTAVDEETEQTVEPRVLTGHANGVYGVDVHPSGRLLASAGGDGIALVRTVDDGAVVSRLSGHRSGINRCVFSTDGTQLLTVSDDGTGRLWDWRRGDHTPLTTGGGWLMGGGFTSDGSRIITVGQDRTVRLWDRDGRPGWTARGHESWIVDCSIAPDDASVATCGENVRVWEVARPRTVTRFGDGEGGFLDCAFSPDGTLLAAAGSDHSTRLWHTGAAAEGAGRTGTPPGPALGFDVHAVTSQVAVVSPSRPGIDELEPQRGAATRHLGAEDELSWWACAYAPEGDRLVSAGSAGVWLWDTSTGERLPLIEGRKAAYVDCAYAPDGSLVAAVGTGSHAVFLTAPDGGGHPHELFGHTSWVRRCAFSPGGRHLATVGDGLWLWDVRTRSGVPLDTGRSRWLNDCAFSPDGAVLAVAGDDAAVTLHAPGAPNRPPTVLPHRSPVTACAFSGDGTWLATAAGPALSVWNTASLTRVATLVVTSPLCRLRWDARSNRLYGGNERGLYGLELRP